MLTKFRDAVRFSNPGGLVVVMYLVGIGLTEFPNSGWAKAHAAHPLVASLKKQSGLLQDLASAFYQQEESQDIFRSFPQSYNFIALSTCHKYFVESQI